MHHFNKLYYVIKHNFEMNLCVHFSCGEDVKKVCVLICSEWLLLKPYICLVFLFACLVVVFVGFFLLLLSTRYI